jgi:hypothetical protein
MLRDVSTTISARLCSGVCVRSGGVATVITDAE